MEEAPQCPRGYRRVCALVAGWSFTFARNSELSAKGRKLLNIFVCEIGIDEARPSVLLTAFSIEMGF